MLNGMTFNQLAAECHANNHKWWHDLETGERLERNKGELLMLVVTELAEAVEGDRKNLMDDKLPHRKMIEVEFVDAIIRISDFAGAFGLDMDAAAAAEGVMPPDIMEVFPTNMAERMLWVTRSIVLTHGIFDSALFVYSDDNIEADAAQMLYTALWMLKHIAELEGFDLDGAYTDKTNFNKVRPDHQKEARLAANGKKY